MRHAIVTVVMLGILLMPRVGFAQDISFRGVDIVQLSKTIAAEARRTNQLPPAYILTMANDRQMLISAANAFELLARTIVAWRQLKTALPETVSLQLLDLKAPGYNPQIEPKNDGLMLGVPTIDIGKNAEIWLGVAEAPGHKMTMALETGYKLTAAQYIVAMAALIDEATQLDPTSKEPKPKPLPSAVAIPAVRSPRNWDDTGNPIRVAPAVTVVQVPATPPIDLSLSMNGADVFSKTRIPNLRDMAPFCGTIRLEIIGAGSITKIRLLVDRDELETFIGAGPHQYRLNTLPMSDGQHTLTATVFDNDGKALPFLTSFAVSNGRQNGFTPAEHEESVVVIEAVPAP